MHVKISTVYVGMHCADKLNTGKWLEYFQYQVKI